MREILFRGKRLDNGQWVYGNLMQGSTSVCISQFLTTDTLHRVDPDTVGQYTGLTDIFNEKIFVGDIVKYKTDAFGLSYDYVGIVEWDRVNPSMCIRYQRNPYIEDIEYDFVKCGLASIEVIGNIWDNPDLLKGGDE